ncbi:hypothetical protein WJX81_005874 [Elliptochloris bilobata]|uniref:Protein kinase domain-containing protein n=1 Tax=Elliptochloris bilobata TaxID=381761 RepID=A0AAW1RIS6_9CHLO
MAQRGGGKGVAQGRSVFRGQENTPHAPASKELARERLLRHDACADARAAEINASAAEREISTLRNQHRSVLEVRKRELRLQMNRAKNKARLEREAKEALAEDLRDLHQAAERVKQAHINAEAQLNEEIAAHDAAEREADELRARLCLAEEEVAALRAAAAALAPAGPALADPAPADPTPAVAAADPEERLEELGYEVGDVLGSSTFGRVVACTHAANPHVLYVAKVMERTDPLVARMARKEYPMLQRLEPTGMRVPAPREPSFTPTHAVLVMTTRCAGPCCRARWTACA